MGTPMDARDRLAVALDTPSLPAAEALAARLAGAVRWFKIGPPLFTAQGPAAVTALRAYGRVFLDLKFHDIPSTVAAGCAAAARLGASLCTVHALGGLAMMAAARQAAGTLEARMRVVAVTLLTSGDAATLDEIGIGGSPIDEVHRLARLAQRGGLDGVVASALDAAAVREACGEGFLIVCPGIRPRGTAAADQRRVVTPREAAAAGADLLVVGRPITEAPDPRAAAEAIVDEIASGEAAAPAR